MKVNDRPRGARARACVCVYVWAPPQGRPRVVTTNHHYPFFIITVDRYVHRAIRATDVPLRRSHAVLPRMFGTVPRIRNHRHVEDFADFQGSSQGQGPPHHLTPPVSARMFYIRVVPLCPFTLAAPLVRPRRFFFVPRSFVGHLEVLLNAFKACFVVHPLSPLSHFRCAECVLNDDEGQSRAV